MTWKLWLDDQLDDPETPVRHIPEGWTGAKTSSDFKKLIEDTLEKSEPIEAIRRELEILKNHYGELIEAKDRPHPFAGEIKIKQSGFPIK